LSRRFNGGKLPAPVSTPFFFEEETEIAVSDDRVLRERKWREKRDSRPVWGGLPVIMTELLIPFAKKR
jgi:hypothetical protein